MKTEAPLPVASQTLTIGSELCLREADLWRKMLPQVRRRARRIRRLLQESAAARPTFYPARHA